VTYLDILVEFEPSYDIAQYQLGVEYLNLERYEDVLRHFDQVLSLRPHMSSQIVALQVSIYEKWSRALAEEYDLTGAQEKLHRALQFSPRQ
jgi:tetratricopeptide (TPR) repeat protein